MQLSPSFIARRSSNCARILLIAFFFSVAAVMAAPVTQVVVKTGDAAPDGDGLFDLQSDTSTSTAVLNNRGWVAFRGSLANTTNGRGSGVFLGNGATVLQVARTKDPAPGGTFQSFTAPAVNDSGQLLFMSPLVVNSRNFNLVRSESTPGAFSGLLFHTQAAPDGNGTLFLANSNQRPGLSQTGTAVFVLGATGTSGGATDDSAIYRSTTPGTLVQIVREGQNIPDGPGKFGQISANADINPVLNESGQVVFIADLTGTVGGSSDNAGVYGSNGTTFTKIARKGEGLPGGGTFGFAPNTGQDTNDAGEVVIPISTDGSNAIQAIFKGSGGPLTEIARQGRTIPNSLDTFSTFRGYARINNPGQVAFLGRVTHLNPTTTYWALFRYEGTGANGVMIAREGQATPNGVGTFSDISIGTFCLNNPGQVAFRAGLDIDPSNVTSVEEYGIFFYDSSMGLVQVAREHDALLGSTITELALTGTSPGTAVRPNERSGLNDSGQVAYGFTLADGREGIAIWSPTANTNTLPTGNVSRTAQGFLLQFKGSPAQRYVIQRDDDLSPPWTNLAGPITADSNGNFQFQDQPNPQPLRRFYRATPAP